jgi:2-polyprenyl-3-methyl-5-hydroxy-6-metoxy-1,4-benzoquinol methylase
LPHCDWQKGQSIETVPDENIVAALTTVTPNKTAQQHGSQIVNKATNVSEYDLHTRIRSPIIFSLLQIQREDTVLDLGSGTGYFSEAICKQKASPFCLDISLRNLLSIKKRENNNISLLNAKAEKLPFVRNSFTKILCTEVLEHIKADKTALQEISRVLKPDGTLVMSVPCRELRVPSLIELLGIKTVHDYDGPEYHYRAGYTIREINELFNESDMVVSESIYFCHFFSKLALDIISICHLIIQRIRTGNTTWHWVDIQDLSSSTSFKIFKVLFPFFFLMSKLDTLCYFSSTAKGYGLIVKAKKSL